LVERGELDTGAVETAADPRLGVGPPGAQPRLELLERRRNDEDPDSVLAISLLERACPLDVDVPQNVAAGCAWPVEGGARRRVRMIEDFRTLHEISRVALAREIARRDEEVVAAVGLADARRAGGAGDRKGEIGKGVERRLAERRLAGARGR